MKITLLTPKINNFDSKRAEANLNPVVSRLDSHVKMTDKVNFMGKSPIKPNFLQKLILSSQYSILFKKTQKREITIKTMLNFDKGRRKAFETNVNAMLPKVFEETDRYIQKLSLVEQNIDTYQKLLKAAKIKGVQTDSTPEMTLKSALEVAKKLETAKKDKADFFKKVKNLSVRNVDKKLGKKIDEIKKAAINNCLNRRCLEFDNPTRNKTEIIQNLTNEQKQKISKRGKFIDKLVRKNSFGEKEVDKAYVALNRGANQLMMDYTHSFFDEMQTSRSKFDIDFMLEAQSAKISELQKILELKP